MERRSNETKFKLPKKMLNFFLRLDRRVDLHCSRADFRGKALLCFIKTFVYYFFNGKSLC